eukprot:scpid40461/ scgid24308/ 
MAYDQRHVLRLLAAASSLQFGNVRSCCRLLHSAVATTSTTSCCEPGEGPCAGETALFLCWVLCGSDTLLAVVVTCPLQRVAVLLLQVFGSGCVCSLMTELRSWCAVDRYAATGTMYQAVVASTKCSTTNWHYTSTGSTVQCQYSVAPS